MATSAAYTRLSGLIDQAVSKLESAQSGGTSDADLDALSDKLQAALNPAPATDTTGISQ